jgi:hypothetical protein
MSLVLPKCTIDSPLNKDLAELGVIENIQGVRLDVNKQDQIDAAVKTITETGRGLFGWHFLTPEI